MGKESQVKGNLAVAKVIFDITLDGHVPFIPIFEHRCYDIIVVNHENRLSRIQIRYARMNKNGAIGVRLYNTYSNGNGSKLIKLDRTMFDAFAIYCPDTETVYYIKNSEINQKSQINLRVKCPLNRKGIPLSNGLKTANMANKYIGAKRLFI